MENEKKKLTRIKGTTAPFVFKVIQNGQAFPLQSYSAEMKVSKTDSASSDLLDTLTATVIADEGKLIFPPGDKVLADVAILYYEVLLTDPSGLFDVYLRGDLHVIQGNI